MSTPSVPAGGCQADDSSPLLAWVCDRSAAADPREIWTLVQVGRAARTRHELFLAALGLADELGCHAAARHVTARAGSAIRRSPGCQVALQHLPGTSVAFTAQMLAADAALAVLLAERLSPEVRDALAAPWAAVFGSPFGNPAGSQASGPADPTDKGPAS